MILRTNSPKSVRLIRNKQLPPIPEDKSLGGSRYDDDDEDSFIGSTMPISINNNNNNNTGIIRNNNNNVVAALYNTTCDSIRYVQEERMKYNNVNLKPYRVLDCLNQIAMEHAIYMSLNGQVIHSVQNTKQLQIKLNSNIVGENVQRGDTIHTMHYDTITFKNNINYHNIISSHFNEFGSAIVKGNDGKVYLCQVFRYNNNDDNDYSSNNNRSSRNSKQQ